MKLLNRLGAIAMGYLLAAVLAGVAVAVHTVAVDPQDSAGMASFGDALLFLGVFAVLALPPTVIALRALRPCQGFWLALATIALLLATTALVAAIAYAGWRAEARGLVMLAPLRLLLSPLAALFAAVSAACAPNGRSRRVLTLAALIESGCFVCFLVSALRSTS